MLRDLEELVISIKDEEIKSYMREALDCYNIGSYRASIILSNIAGMHDLRKKIQSLASSLKEFKELDDDIERRIKDELNYENYMIEQAASKSIISTSEEISIKSYADLRNRCAHPNEFVATAEESRMVFTGVIDNIISKPSLLGVAYIRVLNEKLENSHYFPNEQIDRVMNVVREELNRLHDKSYIPLSKLLIKTLKTNSKNDHWKNSLHFLTGMLKVIEDDSLKSQIVMNLSVLIEEDSLFEVIKLIASNSPSLITFLDTTNRERFIAYVLESINSDIVLSDAKFIKGLLLSRNLAESEEKLILKEFICEIAKSKEAVFNSTERSSPNELRKWVKKVIEMDNLNIDNAFFETLIELISDRDYQVVNSAIELLNELDRSFVKRMSEKLIVLLISNIIYQANGPGRGADEAVKIKNDGFSNYQRELDIFIERITKDINSYKAAFSNYNQNNFRLILGLLHQTNKQDRMIDLLNLIYSNLEELRENDIIISKEDEIRFIQKILKRYDEEMWKDAISHIDSLISNQV